MNYELLGNSGLRVSELALGTMTFGEEWGWGAGRDACEEMFDRYVEAGGNFIDTANNYTNGTSERIVGELVGDERDSFVVATKYTLNTRPTDPNAGGNHRKNVFQSVEASLGRLETEYIDLLWVHAWDGITPVEEVMRALNDLVSSGTVHYIGFSDTPAWVVSRAQTLAKERDWAPVSALQLKYNLLERTPERELLPMALELDLGVTVWGPLESGILTGKYNRAADKNGRVTELEQDVTDHQKEVAQVVMDVATETDATPAQVALAWIRQQPGQLLPIVGARTPKQLDDNLTSLGVELDEAQLGRLDEMSAIELGFPHDFLQQPFVQTLIFGEAGGKVQR
ncbi:Predicted oxidoreductase [Haladaptatus litoreus]|uniref:Predicted oxidoreductase n=1 Tax=Haladaptatus litoreus TaxID=553468 RepID=A0A1N6V1K0_9EURY|nr:aldo/keto reductase [Haladaptatus litoreus]SIQ71735.1 Predicted oxidoreductase [Haladaptatus litoreus]